MTKKHGTNEEVITAFAVGTNFPERNNNGSVSHYDNILYSYQEPIAVRRDDGLVVISGDKWSVTTSGHQSTLQMKLHRKNYFTTAFTAVAQFVEMPRRMMAQCLRGGKIEVLDHTEDFNALFKHGKFEVPRSGEKYNFEDLPAGAEIRYMKSPDTGEMVPSVAHMAASVLLRYGDRHGLASMDESQYFCSELPHPVNTVNDAFHALKPQEVLENETALPVFRQGEWFFIPHLVGKEAREQYNQMETNFELLGRNGGNPHFVTRGTWLDEKRGIAEVSGQVRHNEHRMLNLSRSGDPIIYLAVENTAVRSFSAMGRVD